jgi:hypothetical protein
MTQFEQEIYGGIIVVVAGGLLTAGFKALQRGYRCLKLGQGEIMKANQDIALTLKGIEGRFGQGEQWMQMHHEADQTAFDTIHKRIDDVRKLIKT